jgi:2-hydroxy-6-oxonona-2,4-dienedioate hydrolase
MLRPATPLKHGDIAVTGGHLHYVSAGAANGTLPLVLLHGGHGSWTHWTANFDALAAHHRVIAPDLPGFGGSFNPGRAARLEEFSERIVEFLDGLDIAQACLVGFSFGGVVATAVAAAHPRLAAGLVVVNAPGTGKPSPEAVAILEEQSDIAKHGGLRKALRGTLERIMLADSTLIDDDLLALSLANVKGTRIVTRPISRSVQLVPLMEKVSCPALVLLGAKDPHQRHELDARVQRMAAALKHGSVEVNPDAAHWLQYECAGWFNRRVLDFARTCST